LLCFRLNILSGTVVLPGKERKEIVASQSCMGPLALSLAIQGLSRLLNRLQDGKR
jgi:hypothetical protein